MAYALGFTFADGNIYKSSLTWDLQLRDRNVLEKLKRAMKSNYPITIKRKRSCVLRINNLILIAGATRKGLLPKKDIRNTLPDIPTYCIRHFVRGYLDGDGWLTLRAGRNEFDLGFSSGNREFLESLNKILSRELNINLGRTRLREKTTPKGVLSRTYMTEYYSAKAYKIAFWLYDRLDTADIYLDRKLAIFLKAKQLYNYLSSGTKAVRVIQAKFNKPLKELLNEMYITKRLSGEKIAKALGVHYSSIYRWLEQTGLKGQDHELSYGQV